MIKKTMPTITRKETLTNHELLTELQKRIDQGRINLAVDSQQIDNQADETSSHSFGISKSTLILGLGVIAVLAFYFSSPSTLPVQLQTVVKINEAPAHHEQYDERT